MIFDLVVIGGGPAGVVASLRAGDLGAKTALVTEGEFGGMAANDGPVPVRALAHAARLMRDARQLGRYGVQVGEPQLDYSQLLQRVREVVNDARGFDPALIYGYRVPDDAVTDNAPGGIFRYKDDVIIAFIERH